MTRLYITIDTEYSVSDFRAFGYDAREPCYTRSILGRTRTGSAGVPYQLDVLVRRGLKAVFFVDPMPALVWGIEAVSPIVELILAAGQDVQLHLHTEWLEHARSANPVDGRTGRDMKDFTLDEQVALLHYARGVLIAAGAPSLVAFRAGNYGANDDTLRPLASVGMRYDTSYCPGFAGSACAISLGPEDLAPIVHCGITEVPIGCIQSAHGARRHFQLTALSVAEMVAALRHAARQGQPCMTLVSHCFELLSRDKSRLNRIVRHRFEHLCKALQNMPDVSTATYASCPPTVTERGKNSLLAYSPLRTARRYVAQGLSNVLYGAR